MRLDGPQAEQARVYNLACRHRPIIGARAEGEKRVEVVMFPRHGTGKTPDIVVLDGSALSSTIAVGTWQSVSAEHVMPGMFDGLPLAQPLLAWCSTAPRRRTPGSRSAL